MQIKLPEAQDVTLIMFKQHLRLNLLGTIFHFMKLDLYSWQMSSIINEFKTVMKINFSIVL